MAQPVRLAPRLLDARTMGRDRFLGVAPQARGTADAESKREIIEQDRFAGAGLAGEHREPRGVIDVEPFDQNDVADRETGEHLWSFRGAGDSPASPESITTKRAVLK